MLAMILSGDEGPVVLQKSTPIGPDDTLGEVYFNRLFPMGVAALLESADLVTSGRGAAFPQDHQWQSTKAGAARPRRASIGTTTSTLRNSARKTISTWAQSFTSELRYVRESVGVRWQ